eukprot:CAMPEP_0197290850 /NCGR_PEP_ID=MMETSP0890-20130614/10263_1 /TAXON_ID=44058 ORGANISM="Aureoumbra lagunensis, Strain CCMP1510" /NCGR_SAMPLE_ID=MMETSP0890 /ASSEMBLY_ACC=CAM_ASM_000533 /LENGTH=162 /DNA_ID=CAMNT_0042763191 /DNA_START=171 /DNA_END=659 /DNA_ORIENTATION=-
MTRHAKVSKKYNGKLYPSKKVDAFNKGRAGIYSTSIIPQVDIRNGQKVSGADPGMKDPISSFSRDNIDSNPEKGPSVSKKQVYAATTIPSKKNDDLTSRLSDCSLKTTEYTDFMTNFNTWSRLLQEVFDTYGTDKKRKNKMRAFSMKQKYYDRAAVRLSHAI